MKHLYTLMKSLSAITAIALFIIFPQFVSAQVNAYTFTQVSGTYTPITGGTTLGFSTNDDTSFPNLPIGFTFNYNNTAYTSFSVNSNGFIALGATVNSSFQAISDAFGTNNIIAANNLDLQGNSAGGDLQYQTIGTAPNRVLVVQWSDYMPWSSNNGEHYNFQIRLYETTDVVETMYGTYSCTSTRTPQVGLRGNNNSDFNNRTTTTSWAASTAGTANSNTMSLSPTVFPASGLTFRWTPPPPTPMAYVSSTTMQNNTTSVTPGSTNNEVIGISIVTSGTLTPFDVTSFTLNSNGTTNFATDVSNVNVWYTGSSATFATTTLFGSATSLASPITGSQTLSTGNNYFWVTYDLTPGATIGDFIDAECTAITMSGAGGTQTPTVAAPAGNRLIDYCQPSYSSGTGFGDYISLVQLGSINNSTTGGPFPYYTYYNPSTATTTTSLFQTQSYTITLSPGTYTNNDIAAWIDYNHDGVFASTEQLGQTLNMGASPATTSFTFTVPLTALTGTTRLRVREADQFSATMDPCTGYSFGEAEDYNITILALPPIDAGVTALTQPLNNSCHTSAETVAVTVKNFGANTLDFSVTPLTVNAAATGTNPVTFTPVTITTGTLAPAATMPVTITTTYNMLAAGTYTFNASSSISGDGYAPNDAMAPVTMQNNTPTVTVSPNTVICRNDSTPLSVTATPFGTSNTPLTANTTTSTPIQDFVTSNSPINIASTSSLASQVLWVRIDSLTHTWDSDVSISLVAPNGSFIDLSSNNGGSLDNYIGTTFIPSASTAITAGSAPFTGQFLPEQAFTGLSGTAQGTWNMRLYDQAGGDQGTLWKWTIALPGPNSIVTYSWSPATGLSSATIANPMASPATTTSYTVTATDANGCSNTDTLTITVNQLPVVTLGVDTGICANDSIVLDAGPGFVIYSWSNSPFSTQTVYAAQAGTYSVQVYDGNGCANSDTIAIMQYNPQVNLGPDIAICQGDTATLDAGPGFTTYNWSTTANTQQVMVSTANSYMVDVTDIHGCPAKDTIAVTVNALPAPNLGSNVTTCNPTVTLNAGAGFNSYNWSNNDTTQQTLVTTSGNYIVTVTNGNGCNNSDTVNVTINPTPVVNLGLNIVQCGGTATLNAGNAGATYQWSNGPVTQLNQVSTSGTYSVLVTNSFGCFDSDTVQVTIYPSPVPFAGNDTVICAGSTINLMGTPNGYVTYTWTTSNFSANGQVVAVSPGVTTSYALDVIDVNGCSAITPDSITVTVIQPPVANFTSTVNGGFNVTFTNQSSGSINPTYSWDFGDGSPFDNSPNTFHTYNADGVYMVTLTVTSVCGTDVVSEPVVITGVGIEEAAGLGAISIYPNPNGGVFNVSIKNAGSELTLDIIDIQGQLVYSEKNEHIPGEYLKQLDLSGLAKGIYYLRLNSGTQVKIQKLIIQ